MKMTIGINYVNVITDNAEDCIKVIDAVSDKLLGVGVIETTESTTTDADDSEGQSSSSISDVSDYPSPSGKITFCNKCMKYSSYSVNKLDRKVCDSCGGDTEWSNYSMNAE